MVKTYPEILAAHATFKTGVFRRNQIQLGHLLKFHALIVEPQKFLPPTNISVISDVTYVSLLVRYMNEEPNTKCVLF